MWSWILSTDQCWMWLLTTFDRSSMLVFELSRGVLLSFDDDCNPDAMFSWNVLWGDKRQ